MPLYLILTKPEEKTWKRRRRRKARPDFVILLAPVGKSQFGACRQHHLGRQVICKQYTFVPVAAFIEEYNFFYETLSLTGISSLELDLGVGEGGKGFH